MIRRTLLGFFTIWLTLLSSFSGIFLPVAPILAAEEEALSIFLAWEDSSEKALTAKLPLLSGTSTERMVFADRSEIADSVAIRSQVAQSIQSLPKEYRLYSGDAVVDSARFRLLVAVDGNDTIKEWFVLADSCVTTANVLTVLDDTSKCQSAAQPTWVSYSSATKVRVEVNGVILNNGNGDSFVFAVAGQAVSDTYKTFVNNSIGTKVAAGASNLDAKGLMTKLGAALCQGRSILIELNADLSSDNPKYWVKDKIAEGETVDASVAAGLKNPGQVLDGVVAFWNAVSDGGTYEKLNQAGKTRFAVAGQHLDEAEAYYTELRSLADDGKIDENAVNIPTCGGQGAKTITKLGDPDNPEVDSAAWLLKRAKIEQKLVEDQPTTYSFGECNDIAAAARKGAGGNPLLETVYEVSAVIGCQAYNTVLGWMKSLIDSTFVTIEID